MLFFVVIVSVSALHGIASQNPVGPATFKFFHLAIPMVSTSSTLTDGSATSPLTTFIIASGCLLGGLTDQCNG